MSERKSSRKEAPKRMHIEQSRDTLRRKTDKEEKDRKKKTIERERERKRRG
jgi:hypothetical protein